MENIDIDIDIDKDNLKNIDIDIDMAILENIYIDIDIDKGILQNIDIDKISYRLGFGISNTPTWSSYGRGQGDEQGKQELVATIQKPAKDVHNLGQTLSCVPGVQLRQHSLVQPLLDFQAHPQQRHEPGVPKRFE